MTLGMCFRRNLDFFRWIDDILQTLCLIIQYNEILLALTKNYNEVGARHMLREIKRSLMTVRRPSACCGRVWRFHCPIFNLTKKSQSLVQSRTECTENLC